MAETDWERVRFLGRRINQVASTFTDYPSHLTVKEYIEFCCKEILKELKKDS